jgi:hypothetical protein
MKSAPPGIVNATAESDGLCAQIQALERLAAVRGRNLPAYAPVVFVTSEKVTRADQLLLAFQALALSAVQGPVPPVARLVHGSGYQVVSVKIESLLGEVRLLADPLLPRPPVDVLLHVR